MKQLLFYSFRSWRICLLAGLKSLLWGMCRIATCLALGIASILAWIARLVAAFCRRETIAAAVFAVALSAVTLAWIATFASTKTRLTTAEHQRDSIAYTLDRYMQAYNTVIIDGDTLKINY